MICTYCASASLSANLESYSLFTCLWYELFHITFTRVYYLVSAGFLLVMH